MNASMSAEAFGTEKTSGILFRIAPPVMLAQLIQALYNIVDSYFVGKFSDDALTALSVIYPIQLLITALSVGTGTGVNALMARRYAHKNEEKASLTGGMRILLAAAMWAVFAVLSFLGVGYTWFAFPASEVITGAVGFIFYYREVRKWKGK